ncbi:hypothetical protein [Bacillus paranthracis]|uniref:hypothetical protein n=1 Tax=Bacillus paranthracis TaxID=2026186 RepID=UPI0021D158FB|nr:hypothetical protein [Bacillus paranthracis]MCU5297020.1 hypothetical protein [Bacillus paranthracis]
MANGPESKITFKVFNQEFNKAMGEMKNESSKLRQEFTLQQEQLKLSGTETEKLNAKLGYLQQQQQLAAQKVAATEQQLSKAKEMYGENSIEVEKLSRQLGNAQIAEQKFSNQVKETESALQRLEQQNSSTAQAINKLGTEETELVNKSAKLRAEYDLQRASLGNNATESEKLGAKLQYLSQAQQNAAQQTKNCEQQLAAAKSQYGENSAEVNKLETKLLQLSTAEQQLKNQIETTNRSLKEQEDEAKRVASSTKQLETLFEATGTSVDHFANALGGHLTSAIKQGTASSSQLDEAIKRIGREALGAETDIEKLQRALRSVDDGNSIQQVQNELRSLQQEAGRTEKKFEGLKVGLENVIGGMAAGGGIAAAIEKAMDMSKLQTKIDISFNVPESSKKSVEEAVRGISAYGLDAEEALEGVRRQWALNKDVSDEANASFVKSAAVISQSYAGIDFTELIQEVNEVGSELGLTQEGALGLTNALLNMGFPPEQLDIIAEYGGQLTRAGYSAEEVQAIMAAGVETGTWNIDNLLDGLKEGRIKAAEFGQGVDKAMTEALEGTKISAEQVQKWGVAVANGGKAGSVAMTEIAQALSEVDDETKRNELGVKFFGTMYEDQGQNIINTLLGAKDKTIDFGKQQDQLNDSIKKMDANPAVKFQKAMQDLQMALKPVLGVIADVVAKIADWISNNPKLAATLAAIAVAIGVISGAFMALAPIVVVISGIGAAMMGWIAAIALIVAAVVALGVVIYNNWDSITKWTIDAWNAIGDFLVGIWTGIAQWASDTWNSISESTSSIWNSIKEYLIELWNGIKDLLTETWNTMVENTTEIWNSVVEYLAEVWNGVVETLSAAWNSIKQTTSEVWTAISEFFISIWNGLVVFITPVLQGIADFFSMIWNGISTVIQSVWNFITQYLQAIWTAILYFATPIFESIKNFISECWDKIKFTTSLVWEAIKNFLVSCWNGLVAFVVPIFEKIKSWIIAVWNTISSTTKNVWNAVRNFLQSCWNGLVSFVVPIFNSIKDWIISTWNKISSTTSAIWNNVKNFLYSVWNSIVSVAASIFNSIKDVISGVWNKVSNTSSNVWSWLKGALTSIWNDIKSTASSVWYGLTDVIMTPVYWVTNAVTRAFYGMQSAVLGVWSGLKSGIKAAINGIIYMINKFIYAFNTPAQLLNRIPGVNAPMIPYVPMLAKGGHVLGDGQFIAGEAGPELFSKKGNKVSVTPLSSSERMGGIGGQLDLVTKNAVSTIQNVASQLAQMVTYDVPNALGEALLASVPNISAATSGGANQQPIEVNFYNTVRNDKDIDRMFEKADDWFTQKGRNLNIGIGRN